MADITLEQLDNEIENYFISGITPKLMGASGIGKSAWAQGLTERFSARDGFEWGFGSMFPATYSVVDVNGYLVPKDWVGADGIETKKSVFTVPPYMFDLKYDRLLSSFKKAILLIDEADKADPDVKKGLAELVLHKRIGKHYLGDNVFIIQCANKREHRSGSTKDFDFVINREGWLNVKSSFKGWETWAMNNGVPPIFIMFAQKNQSTIFDGEHPKEQGPWCTPRSYAGAIRHIQARMKNLTLQGKPVPKHYGVLDQDESAILQIQLNGIMGAAATTELVTWLKTSVVTPDFKDIVANPQGTDIPKAPDAKLLTIYQCSYDVTRETISPVIEYIKRFTPEFHITFFKGISRRNNRLVAEPEVMKFIAGNSALMNAIN